MMSTDAANPVRLITGGLSRDHRGVVQHVNAFRPSEADRFYVLHPARVGEVRGWMGHRRDAKWFFVVSGSFDIGVVAWPPQGGQLLGKSYPLFGKTAPQGGVPDNQYPITNNPSAVQPDNQSPVTDNQIGYGLSRSLPVLRYTLKAEEPAVLEIPPGHFTAIIAREPNSSLLVFSTGTIETAKEDDYRLPADYWGFGGEPVIG